MTMPEPNRTFWKPRRAQRRHLCASIVVCLACGCGGSPPAPPTTATPAAAPAVVATAEGAATIETADDRTEPLGAAGRWKSIPPFLEGAKLHKEPLGRGKSPSELACTIRTDGVVVLAAARNTRAFDTMNNPQPKDWNGKIGEVPGWEPIGKISKGSNSEYDDLTLFRREVKAGESLGFENRFFYMPYLVVLHGTQGTEVRSVRVALSPILPLTHLAASRAAGGLAANSARDVVMLRASDLDPSMNGPSMLERELVRQAILLAAREELGLATRDRSLREPFPEEAEAAWLPFDVLVASGASGVKAMIIRPSGTEFEVLWQEELAVVHDARIESEDSHAGRLELLAARCEALSRTEFVEVLKRCGLESSAGRKPEGAASPQTALQPPEFNFIDQFVALRRLHAEIRRAGESDELLGALARGYAAIGAETAFLWSPAHKAFEARAMLYAERLVQRGKVRAGALWNRAFVRALLGRHQQALDDLAAAALETQSPQAPAWVELIRAHCEFDLPALQAAEHEDELRPLAVYLQMLEQEFGTGTQTRLATLAKVLKTCPDSFRALDLVALHSPLGLARAAREQTLRVFPLSLAQRLPNVAGAPDVAIKLCDGLRDSAAAGDLAEAMRLQVTLVESLQSKSAGEADRAEPSLSVLSSLIRDAGFAHAFRQVEFVRYWLAAPADEAIEEVWPLVKGHPYEKYVAALRSDKPAAADLIQELAASIDTGELELTETRMLGALGKSRRGASDEQTFYGLAFMRSDNVYRELAQLAVLKDSNLQLTHNAYLKYFSPHAPITVQSQILAGEFLKKGDQLLARGAEWEKKYAESSEVLGALARLYMWHDRDDDAIRVAKREFEISQEFDAGIRLARLYDRQDDAENWKVVLDSLMKQRSLGLEHARVQVEFANRHMRLSQWDQALPYALAAAETWSGWGLLTASRCYQGMGNWKMAELYVRRCSERYDSSSFDWFFWCKSTGHGDVEAAQRHAAAFVNALPQPPPDAWKWHLASYDYLSGEREAALKKCISVFEHDNVPFAGLMAAVTAQAASRPEEAAKLLTATSRTLNLFDDAEARQALYTLVDLLREQAGKAGSGGFDEAKFESIVNEAPSGIPTDLYFFAGAFMQHAGQKELSQKYLMEAACSPADRITRILAAATLVELHVELRPLRNKERETDRWFWR